MILSSRARACATASALAALLLANTALRLRSRSTEQLFGSWRAFDDFAIAAGYDARGQMPVAPYRVRDYVRRPKDPRFVEFRERLFTETAQRDLRASLPWRTLPADSLSFDGRWLVASRFDDSGRALLLGIAFRILHGVAPFLIFWLGALAAAPVLAWVALEFRAAGHALAGTVLLVVLAASAFVLDLLSLGYSAAAFHLVALLVLVALATHAILGRPTARGLLVRAGVGGAMAGLCALCRGTVPFLLPGFTMALLLGAWRVAFAAPPPVAHLRRRRLALWAASLGLLVLPFLGVQAWANHIVDATRDAFGREARPQYHDAALLVWKGLGDFDRSKGYHFRDKAGEEAIVRVDPEGQARRDSEVLLRERILSDIRHDPGWMAGILTKRLLATVSLYKLWPWRPLDRISFYPATSDNEGVIDNYYGLTAQADWIALGPWSGEAPVVAILAPLLLLVAAAFVPGTWRRLGGVAPEARRSLVLLACVALAVLPVPVVITTATALEAECFVLVHFLALALLVDVVTAKARARPPTPV